MSTAGRIVACVCIFSTLFMGCYSSVLVDPLGDEKGKIYSNRILKVVTKDSTIYIFDKPPTVVNDTIVGEIRTLSENTMRGERVTIPLADVGNVSVREGAEWTPMVLYALVIGGLVYLIVAEIQEKGITGRTTGGAG